MYTQQIPILKMVIKSTARFNDTYADNAGADINKKQYTYKAKGINAGAKIDIYSGVDVTFSGISPDARVIIDNDWDDDYLKTLTFTADKASLMTVLR